MKLKLRKHDPYYKEIMHKIAKNVIEFRESNYLTQQELANLCGVSRDAIKHIENEETIPNLFFALKLADKMQMTLNDLVQ